MTTPALPDTRLPETSEDRISGLDIIKEHLTGVPAPVASAPEPEVPVTLPELVEPEERDPVAPDPKTRVKILNTKHIMERPPIQWLVDGVVPERGLSLLYAPPGAGKSFWNLDLALCVASGIQWNGHPTKHKIAITVAYEGIEGMKQRLEAWRIRNPNANTAWFGVIEEQIDLMNLSDLDRLIDTLHELPTPVGLLTLDTYARSLAGRGDENSASDTGRYIAACDRIIREIGCHIQIVHHSNAEGSRERGSTALRGAVDTAILLKPETDDQSRFTVICSKQKDGAPFKPMHMQLVSVGNSCIVKQTTAKAAPPAKRAYYGSKAAPFGEDSGW